MKIRATEERDLPAVMEILHQAQAYFKAQGIVKSSLVFV